MKFGVLVLDYDGTTAESGTLHPEVRAAIAEARSRGVAVILATGRILSELRREVGDLRFLDAIVAENGAVLAFPESGRSTLLGQAPSAVFLQELRRRGIDARAGECVVEAEATLASRILPVIRELELPLTIMFNRERLMVLPQSISKATGLREALTALRLSVHNAIAIGDAENDHDLLNVCEIGVAVTWGSPTLQSVADEVLEGMGPAAVAAYIRQMVAQRCLPPERTGRRHLILGSTESGQTLQIALRGRNVLVAGDPKSGKSWVAGLLCEQLILQRYCVCVIDPEGDYGALESLPGVMTFGREDPPPKLRDLTRALRYPDASIVIDLSKMAHDKKRAYVNSLLRMLVPLRRQMGLPHRILVDEAHYFLHEPDVKELLDLELAAYTLVTYRVSNLHPDVLKASEAIIVTRETDPAEVRALLELCGIRGNGSDRERIFESLAINEAVLLSRCGEPGGGMQRFQIAPRLTPHVRHRHKYLDVPVPEGEAFLFTHDGAKTGECANTLRDFVAVLGYSNSEALDGHLRNHDFSKWIADVFGDYLLASQIRELETQYQLGRAFDINDSMIQLIQERYAVADEP
ncbi:MAG: HAD family hydrolase [Acidobacteria bacterium]|nr:HAD family hydrolase [Acidobacteriota bacterium]